MTREEVRIEYPVGCRVRATEVAAAEYQERFSNWQEMVGTVVVGVDNVTIHVDWGGEFRGHRPNGTVHGGDTCTAHCWYMNSDMITRIPDEITAPINGATTEVIPRLRVTISRVDNDYRGTRWQLTVLNGPMPSKYEIREQMDKSVARRIGTRVWSGNEINGIISKGIDTFGVDPQDFIDAITAASLAKQAREETGTFQRSVYDSELQSAMGTGPAILAIGDQLFSLQPRGVVKTGRAMAAIRERIVGAAKKQAVGILTSARTEANGLILNGERQLKEARRKIEIELSASRTQLTLPQWVSDNYIKVRRWDSPTYKMAIGIEVNTRLTAWQMTHNKDNDDGIFKTETIRWEGGNINILSSYHTITIWIPFNPETGSYAYKSGKIIDGNHPYMLPHISAERCCMELQGLPVRLTTMDEYIQLLSAITRGSMEVNLISLLKGYNSWHPDIQAQCPVKVKKILDNDWLHRPNMHSLDSHIFDGTSRINVEDEAKEVFNLESLAANRIARGEALPVIEIGTVTRMTDINNIEAAEDDDHHLVELPPLDIR